MEIKNKFDISLSTEGYILEFNLRNYESPSEVILAFLYHLQQNHAGLFDEVLEKLNSTKK